MKAKKKHLTIEGFLRKFAKEAKRHEWKFQEGVFSTKAIRCRSDKDGWPSCPITSFFGTEADEYEEAAKMLGLSPRSAEKIALAADDDRYLYDPRIRARLLRACGLEEGKNG